MQDHTTSFNQPKILLIEDNETYRKAVKLAMDVSGFTVFEAGNGREALEIAKRELPHVIVCDVHMPQMDGITFLTEAKKDPLLMKIPVIMLTNMQEEIENTVKLGAEEAILKSSLTPHQVVDVCKKHLQQEKNSTAGIA